MERGSAEKLEKMLYTTSKPDELVHRCVVAIDAKHAVSFRHGQHSLLEENATVFLYNTVVSSVSDTFDLIIFKLINGEFATYPHAINTPYRGKAYLQLGLNPDRQPLWIDGIISEKKLGFYVGTSHGEIGDSGAGIFDSCGQFLGFSIGKKSSAFNENMLIGEVADHHEDTQIISSEVIVGVGGIIDADVSDFEPT